MSLSPGFLDEIRNRVPISRVIGKKVVWDLRKSNQARGDWWAPCPFHQEKSASFHCDDQKGYYYCFGCHAKGDAIKFLREADGMEFIEAVKLLAAEAGLQMPEPDPRARERTDHRTRLLDVTEAACRWFRLQLQTAAAAEARDYLVRRGLDQSALNRFEIGFAPDTRTALTQALRDKGFDELLIVESGMSAKPDNGGAAYDRFRGRIIFPIRDAQGRCIGFGGRAMDPNAPAKYLNSPETPLFDKGRNLYNLGPARAAVAKGQRLVVAEGYMDVIALVRAGFEGAVAPLGTAITEDQLRLMWRVSSEPVIALAGDAAGHRAAQRLMDLALPMTGPGQALRFVILPAGQDPDDLIKAAGPGAMGAALDQARPLVDLLWSRETEGQVLDSPERKAALEKRLQDAVAKIPDERTRNHYAKELRNKQWELFKGPSRRDDWKPGKRGGSAKTSRSVLPIPVAAMDPQAPGALLEGASLLICALRPELVAQVETRLERLTPQDPDRAALLFDLLAGTQSVSGRSSLETLLSEPNLMPIANSIGKKELPEAAAYLREILDRLEAKKVSDKEISRGEREITGEADEGLTWRFRQIGHVRHRIERFPDDDPGDDDDRGTFADQLTQFVDAQIWRKPPRR